MAPVVRYAMSESETFRLGTFLDSVDRPSLEELAGAIDEDEFMERDVEEFEEDDDLIYKDKARNVRVHRSGDEYDFCHFRYVSDTKDSYRVRTEDDEEHDANDTRLASARALYFENGQFVFESNDDIGDAWIPRFIGRASGYDIEGGDYQLYTLGPYFMADAYDDYDVVTKVKLDETTGEDELSGDVSEFIQELAGEVTSFEFSSGGSENLKNKDVMDSVARSLDITGMNAKYEDGYMKTFSGSSVKQTLDYEDANPDNMEEKTRRESLAARDVVKEELQRADRVYDD